MTEEKNTDASERQLDSVVGLRTFEASDALGNGDFYILHRAADEIKRLRKLANHLRFCRECAETDVEYCTEGRPLWDACMATPNVEVSRNQQRPQNDD